ASAVIIRLTPLGDMISTSDFILLVRVESVDPKRPAMMLKVEKVLEGKTTLKSLPVLIKGDAGAIKKKEVPQLLERVAPKLPIVLSATPRDKDRLGLPSPNGPWFALTGQTADGEARWVFEPLEPSLRRTYRGTTAELLELLADVKAGKRKPPAPD